MTTLILNITTPFPSPDTIRPSIVNLAKGCKNLILPTLSTLPSPPFPTISAPSIEGTMASNEISTSVSLTSCCSMYTQLSNVPLAGPIIDSFFPTVPVIGISPIDAMCGSVNTPDILNTIKGNLPAIVSAFDSVTLPWYPDTEAGDFSLIQIWQTIMSTIMSTIMKAFGAFVDYIFSIAGDFSTAIENAINALAGPWGTILTFLNSLPPTFDDIMAAIKSLFGLVGDSYTALLNAIKQDILTLQQVMAAVSAFFTGTPGLINLSAPFFPDVKFPSFEIREALKNLYLSFPHFVLNQVWNFLSSFLGIFGLSFPPAISLPFPITCNA